MDGSSKQRNPGQKVSVIILHPFLFALYPILSTISVNLQEMFFSDAHRSLLVVLAGTCILLLVFKVLYREWRRAAVVTSLFLILFFSYGHISTLLDPISIANVDIGRHRFLLTAWALFVVLSLWGARRIRSLETITKALNLMSAASLVVPLVTIGAYFYSVWFRSPSESRPDFEYPPLEVQENASSPDIYYIILDAYAREDILREQFGFDNSDFIELLRSRGFYVAQESQSNYLRTIFSLSSSLNMDYLERLQVDLDSTQHRFFLTERLQDNLVRRQLEEIGYRTVAFASSYVPTEWVDANLYLTPDIEDLRSGGLLNEFEAMVFYNSLGRLLFDYHTLQIDMIDVIFSMQLEKGKTFRREIILSALENLTEIPEIPGPKFVFAHIISPHFPYLFGPDGEEVNYPEPVTFQEKQVYPGEESWTGYRDQLLYINRRVEEIIDVIIANSTEPPIIILQADHGPATGLDWTDPQDPYLTARSGILNAYLLPESCVQQLYPSISPVNTFRVISNCVFGSSLELLEDVTYLDRVVDGGLILIPTTEFQD
jgi:hypothetical protein